MRQGEVQTLKYFLVLVIKLDGSQIWKQVLVLKVDVLQLFQLTLGNGRIEHQLRESLGGGGQQLLQSCRSLLSMMTLSVILLLNDNLPSFEQLLRRIRKAASLYLPDHLLHRARRELNVLLREVCGTRLELERVLLKFLPVKTDSPANNNLTTSTQSNLLEGTWHCALTP